VENEATNTGTRGPRETATPQGLADEIIENEHMILQLMQEIRVIVSELDS
jgi:hypothetical protein